MDALALVGHSVTRSRLAKSFASGDVKVGGKAVKPGWVVERPVDVEVELVELAPLAAVPEAIEIDVVHEDEHLLVIDKEAGMVVHPSPGHDTGTLVAAVLHYLGVAADALPVMPGNDETRPGIVHRLDKDTSGLIVVVKTAQAQAHLAKQFETHSIERRYIGVVRGEPGFERRRVETAHARDPTDRRRFAPGRSGRRAVTEFELVEKLGDAAVVRFTLETGRTHQIRMHARYLGHSIFGDGLYGRAPTEAHLRALWMGLGRHALHAEILGFEHPDGTVLRFESPLPGALTELVDALTRAG